MQFSKALLIYGLGLKVDERQWSETVTIKFLNQTDIKIKDGIMYLTACMKQHKERAKRTAFSL